MTNEKEIVLFETEDKRITFPVEVKDETVWLSVSQMAQLFDREESNIRRHVRSRCPFIRWMSSFLLVTV